MAIRGNQPDCYDYVRRYYHVPAYIGVRVRVKGREGVLVQPRCPDQYVWIKFDGDTRMTGPFHPDDPTYLPLTVGATVAAVDPHVDSNTGKLTTREDES